MKVVFTKHALERIKERNIKFEDIEKTLRYYDKIIDNKHIKKINSYVLIVVVSKENKRVIKIITAFKSSKINKYLY